MTTFCPLSSTNKHIGNSEDSFAKCMMFQSVAQNRH